MAGAMKSASKLEIVQKVALFVLVLLTRPPFEISADLVEGLIQGAC